LRPVSRRKTCWVAGLSGWGNCYNEQKSQVAEYFR
jgi:hypothetical protein